MSLSVAVIDALLASGATREQIAAAVKADIAEREAVEAEKLEKRRQGNRERQQRRRAKSNAESRVTAVTERDERDPPKEYISNPPPVSDETGLAAQPKSKSKRGTRLADDFEAPADWIAWAVKKRGWSRADAIDEAECFARYWQAKPGREACKLDWPKTWQNWVTNSRRKADQRSQGPPSFLRHLREQATG